MGKFLLEEASLPGVRVISPFCAEDRRGWFMKSFEQAAFAELGIQFSPFEAFYTRSSRGVLRGLHFQRRRCQDKLVQVLSGAAYDVVADLREGSASFGKWQGFYLTAENRKALYVPRGFAHGFLAVEDGTLFSYLCGGRYDPESDGGVRWDDPRLGIRWPLERTGGEVILSDRDAALPSLDAFLEACGPLSGEASP